MFSLDYKFKEQHFQMINEKDQRSRPGSLRSSFACDLAVKGDKLINSH